jgi:PAS domain S-box-containing protein
VNDSAVGQDDVPTVGARAGGYAAGKPVAAMPSGLLWAGRLASHAAGLAGCLALGYVLLCGAYLWFAGRLTADAARDIERVRVLGFWLSVAFAVITGAACSGAMAFLLSKISIRQQQFRLFLESVSDCLFLLAVDSGGRHRILYVNAAFLAVTGLSRGQVVGERIEDVMPEAFCAHVQGACGDAIRERRPVGAECSAAYLAGWHADHVTLVPLADRTGAIVQLAGFMRDITERKRGEDTAREFSGRLLRSQDEERRRIGRELHDSTAQELAAVAMNLGLVQQRAAGRDATTDTLLADSQAIIECCQRELRTLSYRLHSPSLDEMGLAGAVRELAAGFTQRSGIQVKVDVSPTVGRLPAETEQALFRVVQESLGNVHRHSGSPTATIRVAREAAAIILEVADQGHGLSMCVDGVAPSLGVGIAGMSERLRQLGGRFEIKSSPHGTTVRAIVPVEARAVA